VRLRLHALAYNRANFLRTLALPADVEHWLLTTLREKLVKIGARIVRHGRYAVFQLAEVAVPRALEVLLRSIRAVDLAVRPGRGAYRGDTDVVSAAASAPRALLPEASESTNLIKRLNEELNRSIGGPTSFGSSPAPSSSIKAKGANHSLR
jgi:hypothetical protein